MRIDFPQFAAGRWRFLPLLLFVIAACDHGLEPPEAPQVGAIQVDISYAGGFAAWPPADSLHDLRFVAMRFVPSDTADLLQLNRLVFSDRLSHDVSDESIVLAPVETGPFLYAGVAQKFGASTFDWRPIGIVESNDGVFIVHSSETTRVSVMADFRNPPPFPPPDAR